MKMNVKEWKWMWSNENVCEGMKMCVKEWKCGWRNENVGEGMKMILCVFLLNEFVL